MQTARCRRSGRLGKRIETSGQRSPGGRQLLKIRRHAANNVLPLQAMYDSLIPGLRDFHACKYT